MQKQNFTSPITAQPESGTSPDSAPFRTYLPALLIMTVIFFINFLARIILGPLLPAVEHDLGIDHSQSGSFFFLISLGYLVALIGSGFVSSQITHRRTIICSCAALGGALLLVVAGTSLTGMYPALLLLGLAAGIYLPSGVATITTFVDTRHWGKAFAVHEIAPNLSFVIAPLFAVSVLQWFSWRMSVGLIGVAALGAGGMFYLLGKGGRFAGEAPHPRAIQALLVQSPFWIMVILFGLGISATVGIYTMLPLYLVTERGFDLANANTLVSLSRIPTIATALFSGLVIDRLGPRRAIVLIFIVTGLMTVILGTVSTAWVSLAVFLQPILAVCFFPAGFAMLAAIAPPQSRNVAVSLAVPCGFLVGGGVVPGAIGMLADAGMFSLGIIIVGVCIFAGCFVALFLTTTQNR